MVLRRAADLREAQGGAIESGRGGGDDPAALREQLGMDQLSALNVGAAPCPPEVIEFFHGIGLPLGELWGMSETNAIGACNPPENVKIGTSGPRPSRASSCGSPTTARSSCAATACSPATSARRRRRARRSPRTAGSRPATSALDDDGYLSIVDRKKELIINAAGKNMSPANIESTLKAASPLIGSVAVIGDRRPYNVALIVPDPDAAAAHDGSLDDAIADAVETANARLSNVEQIKRHTVLDGGVGARGRRAHADHEAQAQADRREVRRRDRRALRTLARVEPGHGEAVVAEGVRRGRPRVSGPSRPARTATCSATSSRCSGSSPAGRSARSSAAAAASCTR